MRSFSLRVGRRPLARTFTSLAAIAVLGACADEPVSPKPLPASRAQASAQAVDPIDVTVTNTSGGTEVGSLRWAAAQMTANGGAIYFDPSLAGDTITLGAELYLDYRTIIIGPEDKGITLSGNDQHRVILANQGLVLRNVTITKGNADYGSGIYSEGMLHMEHSAVQGNRGSGAAVFVNWSTTVNVINSTISGNVVGTSGLRYRNGSGVRISHTTIADNAPGAGLSMADGASQSPVRVTLHNSIIANNGTVGNCATTYGFWYEGTNISSDWSCGEVNIVVADPLLMPLANNGGPAMTHAIPHTSPAFNAGQSCVEEVDQRYVARDAKCDVGAFEFDDFTKVTIAIDPNTKVDAATGRALLKGTLRCTRNDTFRLALELHQNQKVGKNIVDIHSASDMPVNCTTTVQPWSATMVLSDGETYQAGAARATAYTYQTPAWVTPAGVEGAVKLTFTRK